MRVPPSDGPSLDLARIRRELPDLDADVPLRYRPIVDRLGTARTVLEIGRGEVGLAHLLGAPVVTCDVARAGSLAPEERFVLATGTSLPFRAASFDAVLAVDVLEHVPSDRRASLIREATRVSRGLVFLAGPLEGSASAEGRVRKALMALRGRTEPWLEEHRALRLPREAEVRGAIPDGWNVERVPNVNLNVWTGNRLLMGVVGRPARILPSLGPLLDRGRTYRVVFVLRRAGD
ncbi:MAG: hypothetical protein A3K59_06490 [Euryarchaeota archaeon RBG_19FT_COMBO_69_17]|nr:MAG: hypothetical protein A3K59_06490 [Euryarchaeota archaeon RBG_19FT_COMBO_69_17]